MPAPGRRSRRRTTPPSGRAGTPSTASPITIDVERIAGGGDGIGTAPDGRIVFVPDTVPGDRVTVEVTEERPRFLRGRPVDVVVGSPDRVEPPCPNVALGCGGCDWQHIDPATQSRLRRSIVEDNLRRLGRLDDVDVRPGPPLSPDAYRTTARVASADGRTGFRRRRSHRVIPVDDCGVVAPAIAELLRLELPGVDEATLRCSLADGTRLIHIDTDRVPPDLRLPDDVELSTDERPASLVEEVAGVRLRVSGGSFFQCRPDGAAAMVDIVASALAGVDGPIVDAYAGVGLFAATVADGRPVTAVEVAPSSVADARHNLAGHRDATIVASTVEAWVPTPAAAVIADPSRDGLGAAAAERLDATGCATLVLVSCDPAALARDARLLVDRGFTIDHVTVLDLFGQTSHVEAVTVLRR